jgi:hypothetical protein
MMLYRLLAMALTAGSAVACGDNGEPDTTAMFDVVVENVGQVYDFPASGVFNTPVGAGAPAPIGPGEAYEFTFDAAPGTKLSFATMFVHSNDFFYAPGVEGIALFDGSGNPISGDVTSQVMLWDAGTEVDQEPGSGADQAPRQSGPDTGAADADATVRIAADAFGNLPMVSDVIQVTITSTSSTGFRVRIENVSTAMTLTTMGGAQLAAPLAPGVWVLHTADAPLFTSGSMDSGDGLEALAEDGDPSGLAAALDARTGLTVPLSPGVWLVHGDEASLFTSDQPDAGLGLEALAEDGDPAMLATMLDGMMGVQSVGAFTTPDGASAPGVILPGGSYSFTITASTGDRLSLATMFVQSNDLFYAPQPTGITLFGMDGMAASGDVTAQLMLWDAGTEVNELPGVGLNQAPRQSGANTGTDENGNVRIASDAFTYPAVGDVIRVTPTPRM